MTTEKDPTLEGRKERDWERRIASMAHQMGKVARIHGRTVGTLTINPRLPSPAASSSGEIYVNPRSLPDPTNRDAIATWIGVTMHEVGHCEWSPETVDGANHRVYNLLEDPRQEGLLVERLSGVAAPLTRAVADLIIANPESSPSMIWPLITGRLYLPDEMREAVYQATIAEMGRPWADEVTVVVGEYMQLRDPGYSQAAEARVLIARMAVLLDEAKDQGCGPTINVCESHGIEDPDVTAPVNIPVPPEEADDESEPSESGGSGEPGEESEPGEPGDGAKAGDDDEGEADGTEDEAADDETTGKPELGDGAGTGDGADDPPPSRDDIQEIAKEVSKEAGTALDDIAKVVLDQIRADTFGATDISKEPTYQVKPVARQAAARLIGQLKPLTDAAEAGLDKLSPSGRLRPDRLARNYRPDRVFDKWQLDMSDAVSAEIVVAVDVSGSMDPDDENLSLAVWILRQVAAKTAARLTIIAWDSVAKVVASPLRNDVTPSLYRGGATLAIPMLTLATDIFRRSEYDRKWLVVMTDGETGEDADMLAPYMAVLEKLHVAVTPIGFGDGADATVFGANARTIKNLNEIPTTVGAMLYDLYRKNVVR